MKGNQKWVGNEMGEKERNGLKVPFGKKINVNRTVELASDIEK